MSPDPLGRDGISTFFTGDPRSVMWLEISNQHAARSWCELTYTMGTPYPFRAYLKISQPPSAYLWPHSAPRRPVPVGVYRTVRQRRAARTARQHRVRGRRTVNWLGLGPGRRCVFWRLRGDGGGIGGKRDDPRSLREWIDGELQWQQRRVCVYDGIYGQCDGIYARGRNIWTILWTRCRNN